MSTIDLRPHAAEVQKLVELMMDALDTWGASTSVPPEIRCVAALNCFGAISGQLLAEQGCPKRLVDFLLHSVASHANPLTASTEETVSNVKH